MKMQHRSVLSYGDDEYLPVICMVGCNLKEKNLCTCMSKKTVKNGGYTIIREKAICQDKDVDIFLTYTDKGFVRGFLYVDGKEYPIVDYRVYASLQIEHYCYDNIAGIRLPDEFVLGGHFL